MGTYELLELIWKESIALIDGKIEFFYFDTKSIAKTVNQNERSVSRILNKLAKKQILTKIIYKNPYSRGQFVKYRIKNEDVLKLIKLLKEVDEE